jgi:hypothetical protein
VWQLHELPHDYYRYTPAGINHLLAEAGFTDVVVCARNDSFSTLAQMMLNVAATLGSTTDGLDDRRAEAGRVMRSLADQFARLAPLDVDWLFPLGYSALARRA